MELTPPSMATSPASPQRKYTRSPSATPYINYSPQPDTGYPSPALLDFHCQSQSPYGSVDTGPFHDGFQPSSSMTRQGSTIHPIWNLPLRSNPTSSTIANIPANGYEPFASYETCISVPYPATEDYQLPLPSSVGLSRTPSSSTSATAPTSISSRSSVGFIPDQTNLGFRIETPVNYSNTVETSSYATSGLHLPSTTARTLHSSSPQSYTLETPSHSWTKQPESAVQSRENSIPPTSKRQAANRPRRAVRKHTTKEEANFQCQVKGCGKFFSRSYNYKSHLETHDDMREYPFPCTMEGCAKKFVRKTDLQRHHQSVHTKERNHKCDYCGRPFARKDTLRRHMEDGCSRRFDLGTLDIQAEDFKGVGIPDRSPRAYGGFGSSLEVLPPIAGARLSTIHQKVW